MKKVLLFVISVMAIASLSGCPVLGIGNKLVVHNNWTNWDLTFLSVVRVPDECSSQKPVGINLLPEPVKPGESFTVEDLSDGRYYCSRTSTGSNGGYVDLAGGVSVDWYIAD